MDEIEKRNVAPINPLTRIDEADAPRVHAILRRRLADILSGDQSYFPDGVQRDDHGRLAELKHFNLSLDSLRQHVDDPSDVLGKAVGELGIIIDRFGKQIDESEPVDNIQIPPDQSPNTADNNIIYVDPEGGLFSPPNPVRQGSQPRDYRASREPQAAPLLGLVSGKPMPRRIVQPNIFFST